MRFIAFFGVTTCVVSAFVRQPTTTTRKSLKTIERRYDDDRTHFLSLYKLRLRFGEQRRWAGMRDTRQIYHKLLPLYADDYIGPYNDHIEVLAQMASETRRSAKIFAREQSKFHVRVFSMLYDGVRYGSWTGMKYDQIWEKYEKQVRLEFGGNEDEIRRLTAYRIVQKACIPNKKIDKLVLSPSHR